MYEKSNACKAQNGQKLDDGSLPCPESVAGWLLRDLWQREECGCSSQGLQSAEQRNQQSSKAMPVVPHQSAQNCEEVFCMWKKGQGLGVLRETLSEIQEIWQSICNQEKRECYIVRRLTPLEAERLQGFPDNWTEGEADTARYKALGNSVALPCVNYVMSGIMDVLDPCE